MDIVKSNGSNEDKISQFQNLVFDSESDVYENESQERVFRDLAMDLEYCFSDQGTLDPEKAMKVIREALEELKKL